MPNCFQGVRLTRLLPLILLVVLAWFASGNLCVRADEIVSFDATLQVQPDASLDVREDITVRFDTPNRHGIKRFIPIVYDRKGNNYTLDLKLLGVTAANGQYIPHTTNRQGRDFFVIIGDPKKSVMGLQQYHLHYSVRRAINFFENAPEIYWNVTGNESHMPVDNVVARVVFPPVQEKSQIRAKAFIGEEGSTQTTPYSLELNTATFTCGKLSPGEGLTIVLGLPSGVISRPTQWQEFLYLAADWWPIVVLPAIALSVCFNMWWFLGRDALKRQAVAVDWEPPKELSPAEVGTLVDEKCDLSDMVSTVVDLAARGYLTIKELKTESLFFLQNRDYEFKLLPHSEKQDKSPLNAYEQRFLDAMFKSGFLRSETVRLSDLKYKFYEQMQYIEKGIYQSLINKGMFLQSPQDVRQGWICIGFLLFVLSFVAGTMQTSYGIGLIASSMIVFCFARTMPARTRKGCEALNQCLGFQRFVKLAEKERIRKLVTDDPTIFGRLLPYAMVLGAADQWAEAFKDLVQSPPDWFISNGSGFRTNSFVRDVGDSTRTMGQTFTSVPASSSAGSGGSGFDGGSSGGGFGGGGTDSW
ncbi:MAG: DUF2207 domain-containing protein [Candidatus Obscuribacterales bacterium]|nr:DUF2207 domain-containing protein [Candidatus Obscuribacterales bacterium]